MYRGPEPRENHHSNAVWSDFLLTLLQLYAFVLSICEYLIDKIALNVYYQHQKTGSRGAHRAVKDSCLACSGLSSFSTTHKVTHNHLQFQFQVSDTHF